MKNLKTIIPASIAILSVAIVISSFGLNSPDEFEHGTIQFGVVVSDLDKSLEFYQEVIGMTKTGGFSINEEFGRNSGLTDGRPFDVAILQLKDDPLATQWKLMSFGEDTLRQRSSYIHDDIGVQYVTIYVNDMKPFLDRIKHHKIELLGNTPVQLDDGRPFVLIQDPDGIFVELIGKN